jgi:hypothetical protein
MSYLSAIAARIAGNATNPAVVLHAATPGAAERAAAIRARVEREILILRDQCFSVADYQRTARRMRAEGENLIDLIETVGVRAGAQYVACCGWSLRVAHAVIVGTEIRYHG